jgi:N-acetylglucosaminyldiphosphoundecaprenol N-acetyl-beta-D-mannosaminyltransferase
MRIDRVSMNEALQLISGFIASGLPHHIVTADASMVVTYNHDAEFARIADASDLTTPDGAGILWGSKRLGVPVTHKVSGVDLAARCIARSHELHEGGKPGWRVFFFGAAPGVAEAAAKQMQERYPHAQIVGHRDGFFTPDDEAAIVEQIRAAKPDILLVALGIPKQEKFIARHKEALGVPVCIGVGGTLDVFSGTVKRAPVWVQNVGLEWLYRTASDPKRRIKKLTQLPVFVRMVLKSPQK